MPIYHIDYINGLDSNDGLSWAKAWKTLNSGATAARIAPGDIIRIAKSPNPTLVGNATWTNLSRNITLAAAVTANVDMCETAWTAAPNVTATTSTTRKEGAASASLAIASAFTTGRIAHRTITATDFSGFRQISFWIRNSVAIAANTLRLVLCSDTAGATIVDSFVIPAIPSVDRWVAFTINKGSALGSSIQSVALYADLVPGTLTILLDNIIVCKDPSNADSLSLTSLISKNPAAYGGNEGWYAIKSINNVNVVLDADTNSGSGEGRGYTGTTETVATYKRETIKTVMVAAASTTVQEIMDSGTAGNLITFSGGWNPATNVQDGDTFFDGQNGLGRGIYLNAKSFINMERLEVFKYSEGIVLQQSINNTITITNANNNKDGIYLFWLLCNNNTVIVTNANNNGFYGFHLHQSSNNTLIVTNANNNGSYGFYLNAVNNNAITATNANNNGSCGFYFQASANNTTICNTADNGTAGIYNLTGWNYFSKSVISEAIGVAGFAAFANAMVFSTNHDNIINNYKIFTDGGLISSEATIRKTPSGIAWRLSPTSTNRSALYPLTLSLAKVAVNANALVTITAWMRRSNTGLTMRLVCKGKQIAGVDSDVVASMAAAADTWEQIQISFTPTEAGVVDITAEAWGGTTFSGYVDDLGVSQA